ncbi:MAG: hypothetical protein KDD78_16820 [Caldilineaceae bacterium]|nr:hypothetical protein [Caldilineaceae bacterium]
MLRRFPAWTIALLLMITGMALAGCAPRAGGGDVLGQAGDSAVVVDLPALAIDYDVDGNPSLGGIPLSDLGSVLPAELAAQLTFDAETIASLQKANIQHIQVNNQTNGLGIYVNGYEVPSIAWDGDRLTGLSSLVSALGTDAPAVDKLLPMLTNLGVAAVLRFPLAEGATAMPVMADPAMAENAQAAQAAFLDEVESPPLINVPVFYDAEGNWTVAGMDATEWVALTGIPWDSLVLPADVIEGAMAAGITEAVVSTGPDGLFLSINGQDLPYLDWSDGKLNSVVALLVGSGALDGMGENGVDADALVAVLEQLLPIVQSTDLRLNVFFP